MPKTILLVEPETLAIYERNGLNPEETIRKYLDFLKQQ